ncbi:MAG: RHS repeat-associated core domain-containing protein, partial [Candidatus Acidiferrales bacterium]
MTNINVASSAYNGCTQESLSVISTAQNQLSGYGYDAAGNMTSIPSVGSYSFNALNQLTSAAGVTYTYDPLGHRVEKSSGTLYLYGPGDSVLEETTLSGTLVNQYIYFGNARVARRDASGNVFYYSQDHLGTSRVLAEVPSGGSTATLCYDADFYPFGGERAYTNTCAQNYKFTGKERDTESHLDNFSARYNSSTLGRFMSPDPGNAGADPTNPQSWNMYTYVLNNPLNFVDPTGLYCAWDDGTSDDDPGDGGATETECKKQGGHWTDQSNPCHAQPGCQATFDWNKPTETTGLQWGQPKSCMPSLGQRISLGIQGGLNAGIGGYKAVQGAAATVAGVGLAPETAGASLPLALTGLYAFTAGSGEAATGVSQLKRAMTGNVGPETAFEQDATIASGPIFGLAALGSGYSKADAERAANFESFYMAGTGLINSST